MPEASWGRHTRWLSTLTIDPDAFGADREAVRLALGRQQIEARPVWKPMHRQPVFEAFEVIGGAVADDIFTRWLCLPSGSNLSGADLARVVTAVREVHDAASGPGA
jgi:pyridoxal phosphate-dependent aminotransferase EpsN